ncbi:MAG: acyl-CoA transferase [Rhizobium sp.]|uniref:Acyl-CoA transferase n=1 Tax=Sphingobium yanoikuyae TaxID=13690 RepID=A0A430BKP5_SPHYA|nr:CoA transferase [Sphingobium yanoikuyae]PZU69093.1 MAG: acyl-CoA transferase [Rhizobium sp.]RSU52218.1 acyl-CoA transferase [Sphingobium yanoikuyae]
MAEGTTHEICCEIIEALDLPPAALDRLKFTNNDRLPSCFPVSELAGASIGVACAAVSELTGQAGLAPLVSVDLRLASLWFGFSIRPLDWEIPVPWDAVAGDYPTRDGWIKLHTNAPHHKIAALSVLQCDAAREVVAATVAQWTGEELEQAIVAAGGCAAKLRSRSEWLAHPQGEAVSMEPLVIKRPEHSARMQPWQPTPARPLKGLRVLDLTRVLAGPVATRFLAGFGAQVLRLDPPDWEEPGVIPEVTLGKRCARINLREDEGRRTFERLLSQADVLVHGYRSDALERLGFGSKERQAICPGLIDVSLDAYGHSGPWHNRRGFDSLVQFSCGVAAEGMAWRQSATPVSLPVQALDHATGYLMAASVVRGILARVRGEPLQHYRVSLARTSELLFRYRTETKPSSFDAVSDDDISDLIEATSWGRVKRIKPPASLTGSPMSWDSPAVQLGSTEPEWSDLGA